MSFGELLHLDVASGRALREERLSGEVAERLAARIRALGDPTRLGLALALQGGRELCVCDLSWIAERPQSLVSHHLKVMKSEGLLRGRKDGKMVMYSLTERGRQLAAAALALGLLEGAP